MDLASRSRREFLSFTGSAGSLGFLGCFGEAKSDGLDQAPRFEFGGVVLSSRPQAQEHLPLDVVVTIDQSGEEKYQATHTVADVIHGVSHIIREEWMVSRVPYTISASTDVHETSRFSTKEFNKELNENFAEQTVFVNFSLNKNVITVHPVSVDELDNSE